MGGMVLSSRADGRFFDGPSPGEAIFLFFFDLFCKGRGEEARAGGVTAL